MNALITLWGLDVAAFMVCAVASGLFKPTNVWHGRLIAAVFVLAYVGLISAVVAVIAAQIVRLFR